MNNLPISTYKKAVLELTDQVLTKAVENNEYFLFIGSSTEHILELLIDNKLVVFPFFDWGSDVNKMFLTNDCCSKKKEIVFDILCYSYMDGLGQEKMEDLAQQLIDFLINNNETLTVNKEGEYKFTCTPKSNELLSAILDFPSQNLIQLTLKIKFNLYDAL